MNFKTRFDRLECLIPRDDREWHEKILDIGRVAGRPRYHIQLDMIRRRLQVMSDRRVTPQLNAICDREIRRLIPALKYELRNLHHLKKELPDMSFLIQRGYFDGQLSETVG